MMRRLPFDSMKLKTILALDCMDERNSMIVVGHSLDKGESPTALNPEKIYIVNYDFDMVHDPRRRIEGIIDVNGLTSNRLLLTASS